MTSLAFIVLSAQAFALAVWLTSLVFGKRIMGAYKAISLGIALIALSAWVKLFPVSVLRLGASLPVSSLNPDSGGGRTISSGVSVASAPITTISAALATADAEKAFLLLRSALLILCAAGFGLGVSAVVRYLVWRHRALRRSWPIGREGLIEYRIWEDAACSFGLLRPVVLLPAGLSADSASRRAMRAHERAHVQLGHFCWNLFQDILACLFWFNPVFALFAVAGKATREMEADAAATREMDGAAYAECLLAEAVRVQLGRRSLAGVSCWESDLHERFLAMAGKVPKPGKRQAVGLLAVAVFCASAGQALPVPPATPPADETTSESPELGSAEALTIQSLFYPQTAEWPRVLEAGYDVKISLPFGWCINPITGKEYNHLGLDLAFAGGTQPKVLAWADGRVTRADYADDYGFSVELAHADGAVSFYAHLKNYIAKVGDTVKRGEAIGVAGSSGLSTGPHLHFQLFRNGRALDPALHIRY